jgi:carbon-monoxide dehydrogenase medium subunit
MMGGTDLFPQMRDRAFRPQTVIDVKNLPGMRELIYHAGNGLTVGAAVTMNQLTRHPDVQAHYSVLAQAAHSVASYQIRNRATVGGNACNASPCADTSPAIVALEGRMVLNGPEGERELPAGEFFVGPGQTALKPNEFLAAIRFPPPLVGGASCYQKLGRSRLGDLALVGVAAIGYPGVATGSGYRFRIALGSVAPVPLRVPAAEEILASRPLNEESLAAAAEKAMEAAKPISDVRASASYQTLMVRTLTTRALRDLWAQLGHA